MKKLTLILVLVLLSTLLFAGGKQEAAEEEKPMAGTEEEAPAGDPRMGGVFDVSTPQNPNSLDFTMATDPAAANIMTNVVEALFTLTADLKSVPHLADSFTVSDDGRVYSIKLREGVLFHNGKEMTSEDVHASIMRWLKGPGGSGNAELVDQVEMDGTYGIIISTNKKVGSFITSLGNWYGNANVKVLPKEIIDKYPDMPISDAMDLVGTGPYKMAEFKPDQSVRLVRFDDYVPSDKPTSLFSGKHVAYFDEIVFHFVQEESVRIAGLQTGEYDFALDISLDQYDVLDQHPDVKPIYNPLLQSLLTFNCANPPFDNTDARQAVAYGIDYQEMGRAMIGDERFWNADDGSMYRKGTFWHDSDAGKGVFDSNNMAKAKELLAKSGYDGRPVIIVNESGAPPFKNGATALKAQLEKIGFNVELMLTDRSTVVAKRATENEWHLHLTFFLSAYPDPTSWSAWAGTNGWITRWDDENSKKTDEIFNKMAEEMDPDIRKELVSEWYELFWKTTPYVHLNNWGSSSAARENVYLPDVDNSSWYDTYFE